jgi:hypothetical protein
MNTSHIQLKFSVWLLIGTALTLFAANQSHSQDAFRDYETFRHSPAYEPAVADVYSKLLPLFQKYYPQAGFTNSPSHDLHFEYAVTNFLFPVPTNILKHEPEVQRGPLTGGILCDIGLEQGKDNDQLILSSANADRIPSSFRDKKYYKELLMAPYSPKLNAHLWAYLCYPPDASETFLKEYRAIMKNFEK